VYGALNQSFTLAKDWSATGTVYSQNGVTETQPSNHLDVI
jgi:hypothetical protein